jgi:hypothetical protein
MPQDARAMKLRKAEMQWQYIMDNLDEELCLILWTKSSE